MEVLNPIFVSNVISLLRIEREVLWKLVICFRSVYLDGF